MTRLFFERGVVLFDAAMGTALLSSGQPKGTGSEEMNVSAPETVQNIHLENISAGSDVVTSNTFGVSQMMNRGENERAVLLLEKAVGLAKAAAAGGGSGGREVLASLCMGPTGELLIESGEPGYKKAFDIFARQAEAGTRAGADFIFLETFADPVEFARAVRAAKGASSLPVFGTMTFGEDGRSYMGASLEDLIGIAREEKLCATGVNCSLDPDGMVPVVERLMALAGGLPVIAQPNAGQPVFADGKTGYKMTDKEFLAGVEKLLDLGISGIGGCCGTTPTIIAAIRDMIDRRCKS